MAQDQNFDSYIEPVHESSAVLVMRIVFLQLSLGLANLVANALLVTYVDTTAGNGLLLLALGVTTIAIQTADAIILASLVLQWASTRYVITPEEIIIERGILHIQRRIYAVDDIKYIEVEQSLLGKLLNYGTVLFRNPTLEMEISLTNTPDPHRYARLVEARLTGK
jgi:uncharacterized membrane protein YdbT with pleckstrin-like domain